MLIRSQDKTNLINMDNLTIISVSDREIIAHLVAERDGYIRLGCYYSSDKAIKVLDMIQEQYAKHYYGQGGQITTSSAVFQPFGFIPPKVFQMPSDEEVEG